MKAKTIIATLAAVMLTAVTAGSALAETLAPNPGRIEMNDLAGRYVTTNIEYKGDGQTTLTLLENEQFSAEAVKALKAGDVIRSNGEEITVETLTWDGPDLWVNKGTAQELILCETGSGVYERVLEDDMVPQLTIGTLDWEILPYIVVLDWVDAESGEVLEDLAVRSGEELVTLLERGDGPSFAVENVHTLFDQNGQPMMIWRFYSPAQ